MYCSVPSAFVLPINVQITDHSHSGIALLQSECFCEDTYLHSNGKFAVSCVGGNELAALVHCDVRSSSGKLFSSEYPFPASNSSSRSGAGESVDESVTTAGGDNIFTLNCITEAATAGELRQHPWHTNVGGFKKAGSRASFDESALHKSGSGGELAVNLANSNSVVSLEDYDLPNGGGSSKKRVRV